MLFDHNSDSASRYRGRGSAEVAPVGDGVCAWFVDGVPTARGEQTARTAILPADCAWRVTRMVVLELLAEN